MQRKLKRKKQKEKLKAKMRKVILILIFTIIVFCSYGFYKENKITLLNENEIVLQTNLENNKAVAITSNKKETIENTYLNFDTIAKLEVPKINLNTYILKDYTSEGMKVCASKYFGPNPNEVGNFCIAGHNYNKENMFNHLIELEIGDELYLTDNKNGKYVYTIYKIYKVKPQNVAPINQETEGKRIVTLITCVNYSKNRLIIQAIEGERNE